MSATGREYSLRATLLLVISLLSLLVTSFTLAQAYQQSQRVTAIMALKKVTAICDHLFDASEKVSVEREATYALLHAADKEVSSRLQSHMMESRKDVDDRFAAIARELTPYNSGDMTPVMTAFSSALDAFRSERRKVDEAAAGHNAAEDPGAKWFDISTHLVSEVMNVWMGLLRDSTDIDGVSVLQMRLKNLLGYIMEFTGRERSLIGALLASGRQATPDQQAKLLRWQGMAELSWRLSDTLVSLTGLEKTVAPYLKEARSHYGNGTNMVRELFYTPGVLPAPPYPLSIDLWIELSLEQIDSLYDLEEAVLKQTELHGDRLIGEAHRLIMTELAVAAIAILLCAVMFVFVDRSILRPVKRIVSQLHGAITGTEAPAANDTLASAFLEIATLVRVLESLQDKNEEMQRTSAALVKHAAQLERSNAELDQFAYVASHDLKAPLRGIDSLAMWIEEDAGDALPELARGHIRMLRGRVSRLEDLLSGILSYSRAGRIVEDFVPVDAGAMVRNIADMWVSKNFTVEVDKLPMITAPRTAIEQIFGNLLSNAAKHHDKGAGNIAVTCDDAGEFWEFNIADDGPGIPPEYREKVFEMFRTLKPRDAVEGSGLGMAIAKKLIEAVGGKVWVRDTAEKRGATIVFRWPKKPVKV